MTPADQKDHKNIVESTHTSSTVEFKVTAAIVDETIQRLSESTMPYFRQDGPLTARYQASVRRARRLHRIRTFARRPHRSA